ncbi:hypothetical protein ACXYX3_17890 [Mycobacterium sp. C3-094]
MNVDKTRCRTGECIRPKCLGVVHHRGLCAAHYVHWREANPVLDPAPAREHIKQLRDAGLTWRHISNLSTIPARTLHEIANGSRQFITAPTARCVLGVTVPDIPYYKVDDRSRVPVIGTARRLQALIAIGYTSEQVASMLDYDPHHFAKVLHGKKPSVEAATARAAAELFERLKNTPAPDSYGGRRARLRAQRLGWALPLAWDEGAIDDPNATVERYAPTRVKFIERYCELVDLGYTDEQIADKLGYTIETLERMLYQRGYRPRRVVTPTERAAS